MAESGPNRIGELREKLDAVDPLIAALLALRTDLTVQVGREKARLGQPTFDPRRESQVVENYMNAVPEGSTMSRVDAAQLAGVVMSISRAAQNNDREAGSVAQLPDTEAHLPEFLRAAATMLDALGNSATGQTVAPPEV